MQNAVDLRNHKEKGPQFHFLFSAISYKRQKNPKIRPDKSVTMGVIDEFLFSLLICFSTR